MSRYKLICIAILSLLATSVFAVPIDEDSARVCAESILSTHRSGSGKRFVKGHAGVRLLRARPSHFVFSREAGNGFAIIAADDCLPTLLGYSLMGSFDIENMPAPLQLWLDSLDRCVEKASSAQSAQMRRRVGPVEPGKPVIGPYIKTKWNQRLPYNLLTPAIGDNHTPTGCVPTAAAQIMNYYKWPENSYSRAYKWELMQDSYPSTAPTAEAIAVATLMRDLGVIMGTEYGASASGSGTPMSALRNIPGYMCETVTDLKAGLDKGPLVVSVSTWQFNHAVVFDGYDDLGLYHINWGWGGECDGYYALDGIYINYGGQTIHPTLDTNYSYLLTPKKTYYERITVPAAFGGVSIDKQTATVGDTLTITLHDVHLYSGNSYSGTLCLEMYSIAEMPYKSYYGSFASFYSYETGSRNPMDETTTVWRSTMPAKDITMKLELGSLERDGQYVLAPKCKYVENGNPLWRDMFQFADGSLVEDVRFTYTDGQYVFDQPVAGDYDVAVSHVVTASAYTLGGESDMLLFASNLGQSDFFGNLSMQLASTTDNADTRTMELPIYLPAQSNQPFIVNADFNFTGTYRIQHIEVNRNSPSGDRVTMLSKDINGSAFTIQPQDTDASSRPFYGALEAALWYYGKDLPADSVFRHEALPIRISAYTPDPSICVGLEVWATPLSEGSQPVHIAQTSMQLDKNYYQDKTIYCTTSMLGEGNYRLDLFGYNGNATRCLSACDTIHVTDLGVDLPLLRLLSFKQPATFYYTHDNYAEMTIENHGRADFLCAGTSGFVADTKHSFYGQRPFRIRAGQQATIYPLIDLNYGSRDSSDHYTTTMRYLTNNGIRDIYSVCEGEFQTSFAEKPANAKYIPNIAFYYKGQPDKHTQVSLYTKGTVRRSVWKDGEKLLQLSDMQTDSTYNTARVCPEYAELQSLPAGQYWLHFDVTDQNGSVWPTIPLPLIIDETDLQVSVEKVEFNQTKNYNYNDTLAVLVTLRNPYDTAVNTVVMTQLSKQRTGDKYFYSDAEQCHAVSLPPNSTVTVEVYTKLEYVFDIPEAAVRVDAYSCRTARESGHLDFDYDSSKYSTITLPHVVPDAVIAPTANASRFPVAYYSINGTQVAAPVRGLYIVRYNDGTVEKRLIK